MNSIEGCPLQVVKVNEGKDGNTLELDEKALGSILLSPEVLRRKVVVVSVAGAFRKGKSFLLDFFLRYMSSNGSDDWLGSSSTPLTGFHWRGGAERDTSGIHMWSKPFLVTLLSGEEAAVLFMDTQGSFDTKSTVKQCATIFALSTMLSSIQVYNIQGNLQEDNLQHLEFFTDYGRIALESGSNETPFQHLEFLIRDWSYPYDFAFGSKGGMELLNRRLEITPDMHSEHVSLRNHITSCFSRLRCYLLPHPGLKVATNPQFDGRIADIDPEFLAQLKDFVPQILSNDVIRIKKINGQAVTCRDLMEYFKAYMKIYQGGTLPEPMSTLRATSEANNLSAVVRCKEKYTTEMNKVCGPTHPFISNKLIETSHQKCSSECLEMFNKIPKMGGEEFSRPFFERLNSEINQLLIEYKQSNQNKNTLEHIKTPGILLIMMIVFYLVTGVFDIVGLSAASNVFQAFFWLFLVILFTWMVVRFSGNAPHIGEVIDEGAQSVADWVITPAAKMVGKKAVASAMGASSAT